jgi:hypothetical protein
MTLETPARSFSVIEIKLHRCLKLLATHCENPNEETKEL